MNEYNVNEIWDFIINNEICSEESARILTDINGYSVEVLNDLIYCQLGYQNIEQLYEYCKDEFDFSMFRY